MAKEKKEPPKSPEEDIKKRIKEEREAEKLAREEQEKIVKRAIEKRDER